MILSAVALTITEMCRMNSASLHAEMYRQMNCQIKNDPILNEEEKAAAKIGNGGIKITGKRK